jgi:hypothetical protein
MSDSSTLTSTTKRILIGIGVSMLGFGLFQSVAAMQASSGNTPVAQMPNAVTLCGEPCSVVVLEVAAPVNLQFGTGSTWAPQFQFTTMPISVDYSTPNYAIAPFDPAPGVVKQLNAQMGDRPAVFQVTDASGARTVTVPALGTH